MGLLFATEPPRTSSFTQVALGVTLALITMAAGCGTESRENKNRPPIPLSVTASVGPEKIAISPRTFGAGPTIFTVANQSGSTVTFKIIGETLERSQGPIANKNRAQLEARLTPGEYEVKATGAPAAEPTRIVVGKERPTSQNELLLP